MLLLLLPSLLPLLLLLLMQVQLHADDAAVADAAGPTAVPTGTAACAH